MMLWMALHQRFDAEGKQGRLLAILALDKRCRPNLQRMIPKRSSEYIPAQTVGLHRIDSIYWTSLRKIRIIP